MFIKEIVTYFIYVKLSVYSKTINIFFKFLHILGIKTKFEISKKYYKSIITTSYKNVKPHLIKNKN